MTFPYSKPLVYTVPPSYYPYGYYNYYQWLYGTRSDKPCEYIPRGQQARYEPPPKDLGKKDDEKKDEKKKESEKEEGEKSEEEKAEGEEEEQELPPEVVKQQKARRRKRMIKKILYWLLCCPLKCTLFCVKCAIRRFWLWCICCLILIFVIIFFVMYVMTKVYDPNKMFNQFLDWLQPQIPKEGLTFPPWTLPPWFMKLK